MNDNVKIFIDNCADNEDRTKYDLRKLIKYILNEGEKLGDKLGFNDVLKREISTIGSILDNKEYRKNYIDCHYKEIEYDLSRIYRARNILVHSGKNMVQDINGKFLDCIGITIVYLE